MHIIDIIVLSLFAAVIVLIFIIDFVDFFYFTGDMFNRVKRYFSDMRVKLILKHFYRKYGITLDVKLTYIHILDTWFNTKMFTYELWRMENKIKQTVKEKLKHDRKLVRKIIKLKYETHVFAAEHMVEDFESFIVYANRYDNSRFITAARRTVNRLSTLQLARLVESNIDALTYSEMFNEGYDFETIINWANMPKEWLGRLQPKKQQQYLHTYGFARIG